MLAAETIISYIPHLCGNQAFLDNIRVGNLPDAFDTTTQYFSTANPRGQFLCTLLCVLLDSVLTSCYTCEAKQGFEDAVRNAISLGVFLIMRRSDREIKNREDILAVLGRCDVIRLGINTPDYPYVVPMNFGMETESDSVILWFHSAPEGLKLDIIRKDPRVGFEADCSHNLVAGEKACSFTMEYESVVGFGNISIPDDDESKQRGLKSIMRHYVIENDFSFSGSELAAVCVLRLDVLQIAGKRLKLT